MIVYLDIEYDEKTKKINDFGAVKENGKSFHNVSFKKFLNFIKGSDYYCGHKIVAHDAKHINKASRSKVINESKCIDTLLLSTLLFPDKPYHKLIKDDKLLPDDTNNPLEDSKNTMTLFNDEVYAFTKLSQNQQQIYYQLLKDVPGYSGFFNFIKFKNKRMDLELLIIEEYLGMICRKCDINNLIIKYPIELAYSLALTKTDKLESLFPRWVIHNYPFVEQVMLQLRGTPCEEGCGYCDNNLNPLLKANSLFDFKSFKEFDGKPLQELAIDAALKNKSLIAVFPTGGGKSFTYQLPALMRGENTRSLTVIISPLQSLMKDQIDNLMGKSINKAVALYGLLDPIERSKNIQRVQNGEVSILYIAPESLRSKTIERLLLSRDIARFVIDEAHCFSTWGQDFRVDYLYIGDFIKNLQEKKNNNKVIPVSCFTATAKRNVISDIEEYFDKKLNLKMEKITSSSVRKNLTFKVFNLEDEQEKYKKLRALLDSKGESTIIYASRTKKVDEIFKKLQEEQYSVSKFHGRMEPDDKIKQQNMFMTSESRIMVATSAFGMGVDKSDIGMVIHFEISNSLENYVQESGRAGRDQTLNANCYILYNESDLDKHFNLLNSTKLNIKEIQQIWTGIKRNVRENKTITKSALEIAHAAGWEDNVRGLQTRVTTAVAALEDAGYIKRGQNSPRVYADSILSKNMAEASATIEMSTTIIGKDKELAKRITKSLISNKYRKQSADVESEARIDYIADMLGIEIREVVRIVELLRDNKILSDSKDLACYIKKTKARTSKKLLKDSNKLERFLLQEFSRDDKIYNFKEINEKAIDKGLKSNVKMLKSLSNYLDITNVIDIHKLGNSKLKVILHNDIVNLNKSISARFTLSEFILDFLYQRSEEQEVDESEEYKVVLFSVQELKNAFGKELSIFGSKKADIKQIENALYYLKTIESIKIEGGFLVIYSRISIKRLDKGFKYTKKDYEKLDSFYQNKVEQIHIVGEYAKKMVDNYEQALRFVNDYFNIDYIDFLKKYFKGDRKKEISKKISPSKFKQLFGELSTQQLSIINDKDSNNIVVAAGPGSGKTKLLVHKLAAISLMEDTRPDQMLMLTFSRAAVTEFKTRLLELLGPVAYYIEIKTFHSFCFDIIGKIGSLDKSEDIITNALTMIENNEVDESRITKTMLVVDEAQDMVEKEYLLIKKIVEKNDNIKLIVVGDDNQNIYEFRKSSNKYFKEIAEDAKVYLLPHNYRSKKNLIEFSNRFVESITNRMKKIPILPIQDDNGEIVIIKHKETNLYEPIVRHIRKAKLEGTTCILTRTNEQASILAGMLNNNRINAELIQENSDMTLFSLYEMRIFYDLVSKESSISIISNNLWKDLKKEFLINNKYISNKEVVMNALKTFEFFNKKIKYLSDFKEFLMESNYTDFITSKTLTVSTLHKSKGREFDNVIIMYDISYVSKNEHKRLLYVGITRAKTNLFIHYFGDYFKFNDIENCNYYEYDTNYDLPEKLVFSYTHKNVNLGYFKFTQNAVKDIEIGVELELIDKWRLQYKNRKILQLSKKNIEFIEKFELQGFKFLSAKVKHKVYWYNQELEEELVIVLPEITLIKSELNDITDSDIE